MTVSYLIRVICWGIVGWPLAHGWVVLQDSAIRCRISSLPPQQRQERRPSLALTAATTRTTNSLDNVSKKMMILKKNDPEWNFFDTARINVQGGDGGNGCVAFRRERGEARGGPNGGRGGRGGSVYLICDGNLNTLANLQQQVHIRATKGKNGLGKNQNGSAGSDTYIKVPPGTRVRELETNRLAGELQQDGEILLVARGGRGGRGNWAFGTERITAPKLAEKGEPGVGRWLSLELLLVAQVGFLGCPNAGKSTLLAAASQAKPKIANYPFTTLIPNLGVWNGSPDNNINNSNQTLVLCDIPGLIPGAAQGAGMGMAFLRHVQRCKVLLHIIDASSADPLADFYAIQQELKNFDEFLSQKPQVVVLNKLDLLMPERELELRNQLREAAGHSRVMSISAMTREGVDELLMRLHKFVMAQPEPILPIVLQVDLSKTGLDYDPQDYHVQSDPAYPNQWRVSGHYVEQVAKMTHWEYPEAVERFGRQLEAMGIQDELLKRGAQEGDLIMIDTFDFEFTPGMRNPYIPSDLLLDSVNAIANKDVENDTDLLWRPFSQGGFLDMDTDELEGFGEEEDWELLEFKEDDEEEEEEVWMSDGLDDSGHSD